MVVRVAFVTGANRGIGEAIARRLAVDGLVTVVAARALVDGAPVASSIRAAGGEAFAVQLDVTDPASVAGAVDAVQRQVGPIDVLVNNAGGHYDSGASASLVSDDDLLDAVQINLAGPWRMVRAVLPGMRERRWGRIVNVSSRSGSFQHTWADAPAYGVTKAALNMMTLQLARELEGSGVLVNSCCPGWVRTRMGGEGADLSVEEGADTPVWLATLPDDGPSGGFFAERQAIEF